ncbi:hypothetical protein B0H16DRAFT_1891847 [Mycena metata]|uniref:Uncharacterized protein n=1 Tax=Mycena metata TaxID=1033252 RepID=A0AAD7MYY3_9AGAR|nr:hypothetical protein B0H16DRAFT_1891847 [Mycena metata]
MSNAPECPSKKTPTGIQVESESDGHIEGKCITDQGDTVWDLAETHRGNDGPTSIRREERLGVRKTKVGEPYDQVVELIQSVHRLQKQVTCMQNEMQAMQNKQGKTQALGYHWITKYIMKRTISIHAELIKSKEKELAAAEVNEKYEATVRCLRAFNEIIFDVKREPTPPRTRILDEDRKWRLNSHGLTNIAGLLEDRRKSRRTSLPPKINTDRFWALDILTPDEQLLCRSLHAQWKTVRRQRNNRQHAILDIETALRRTEQAAGEQFTVLEKMLATNPKRRKRENDKLGVRRELFARPGEYDAPVSQLEKEIAKLQMEKAELEQQIEKRARQED